MKNDEKEELVSELAEAFDLIDVAAKQFRFYEKSHSSKNTPDGDMKAAANAALAHRLEAFLTKGTSFDKSVTSDIRDQAKKRSEARGILTAQLPILDAAAIPTKCEVFTACGRTARDIHDAIVTLTSG
jgi:hypothetical protein